MRRKVIAFDLDGTLAPAKVRYQTVLSALSTSYLIATTSVSSPVANLSSLKNSFSPTCSLLLKSLRICMSCRLAELAITLSILLTANGVRYILKTLLSRKRSRSSHAVNKGFDDLGFREKKVYGEYVEDRGSQITFSALGQDIVDVLGAEGVRIKEEWDPDNKKKQEIRELCRPDDSRTLKYASVV